jgi:oxygen-dependent protoporphyrinogen oxidase
MKTVVIVGGGITGLAAAHRLGGKTRTILLEAGDRLGGNIRTEHAGGFVIDAGPDSWVTTKPEAETLAREVGLEDDTIETIEENRRVYIASGRTLHPLPEGLVLGIPTKIGPLVTTPIFGWDAKLRMALEPLVPRRAWRDDEDESIASFFTRRFGDELTDKVAAPLLGGIFAGDASEISVRSAFPQLVEMEKKGSLALAMRARRASANTASAFRSLKDGLGVLVERVAKALQNTTIRLGARVCRIEHGFSVVLESGERIEADDVILTAPAHALAPALASMDGDLADRLSELRYASTATVFLGLPKADIEHPLDATGFLVPRSLGRPLLASTWVSSKWPHRAPPGHALVRAFFGGAAAEDVLTLGDADLAALAREELARFMGRIGEPRLVRVYRHLRASPQPMLGHSWRMKELFERLPEGMHLAGNGYDGSGIPDCIKQGERAARAVLTRAQPPARAGTEPIANGR